MITLTTTGKPCRDVTVDDDIAELLIGARLYEMPVYDIKGVKTGTYIKALLPDRQVKPLHEIVGCPVARYLDGNPLNVTRANLGMTDDGQLPQPARATRPRKPKTGKPRHRKPGTSGYTGVRVRSYKYATVNIAYTCVNGKPVELGRCDSAEDAARLHDAGARHYHGDRASLNFPGDPVMTLETAQAAYDRGGKGRGTRLTADQVTDAYRMYSEGTPVADLAVMLGVHKVTVYDAFRRVYGQGARLHRRRSIALPVHTSAKLSEFGNSLPGTL